MVGVALGNNRHCFFSPADFNSTCDLWTKAAPCKCLFHKRFLNTVAFPSLLIEKVVSHPVVACRNRGLA